MKSRDVTIEGIGNYGCWIISICREATLFKRSTTLSAELWNCYQTIAQYLLAEWPPEHKVS